MTTSKADKIKNQRPFLFWLIVFLAFFSCVGGYAQENHVYVTDTGTKYHLKGCHYLKLSRRSMTLDSAITAGYSACKVCKPGAGSKKIGEQVAPSSKPSKPNKPPYSGAIRCRAITLKGNRCKRTTKNASGKCWQHEG